jgi:hypothetical protein
VDANLLASRLAKVHNYGVIRCTLAQMGALQAWLGVHEGVLESTAQAKDEEEENGSDIGNANFLAL